MSEAWEDDDWEPLPETTVAWAWREAEQRKAEEEALRLAVAELLASALADERTYFPEEPPHDPRLYEGTGIGALYGLPGTERFLPELGDWKVIRRRTR